MMTRVKVCGVTRPGDAIAATAAGVHALGLNFVPTSKRVVTIDQAQAIIAATGLGVELVGVFANAQVDTILHTVEATGISTIQLHGREPASYTAALSPLRVVRALSWEGLPATNAAFCRYIDGCKSMGVMPVALLLDTGTGGTGQTWNWEEAAEWIADVQKTVPVWIAGGLTPENVSAAVAALRPAGVDTAGGVESAPGIKDTDRMRAFVDQATT